MARSETGPAIRTVRKQNALSQAELASKVGVTQATISNWEIGKQEPDVESRKKLQAILGADLFSFEKTSRPEAASVLAAWLSKTRQEAGFTVAQLAEKSGLSVPTIYGIEASRAENPRRRTMERLEKALGKNLEKEFKEEIREASTIEGIGEFQDFDPHDNETWPDEPGVYVLYDIIDRPIYVGMAGDISGRIKDHFTQFWFKSPIVERASYIPVQDKKLRRQIETILIKFLKSNAIINKQGVERE